MTRTTTTTTEQPTADQADNTPADANVKKLIQLTRNVGRHLLGQTFRLTRAQAKARGLQASDYKVIEQPTNAK